MGQMGAPFKNLRLLCSELQKHEKKMLAEAWTETRDRWVHIKPINNKIVHTD